MKNRRLMRASGDPGCLTGFTLVELLVVVAIIALLLSILLPSMDRVRAVSTIVACQANQRDLHTAMMNYANDHRGHLPNAVNIRPTGGQYDQWNVTINPYLTDVQDVWDNSSRVLRCPIAEDTEPYTIGVLYSTHGSTGTLLPYQENTDGTIRYTGSRRLTNIAPGTMLSGDAAWLTIKSPRRWSLDLDYDNDGLNDTSSLQIGSGRVYNDAKPRHNGNMALMLMDGSGLNYSLEQFVTNEGNIFNPDG